MMGMIGQAAVRGWHGICISFSWTHRETRQMRPIRHAAKSAKGRDVHIKSVFGVAPSLEVMGG